MTSPALARLSASAALKEDNGRRAAPGDGVDPGGRFWVRGFAAVQLRIDDGVEEAFDIFRGDAGDGFFFLVRSFSATMSTAMV